MKLLVTLLLSTSIITGAQKKPLVFEVASVKPVTWQPNQFHGGSCHGIDSNQRAEVNTRLVHLGRCGFENAALGNMIRFAYQERGRPALIISGGDKWIWSDAFEVQATAENTAATTEEQLRLMLQALLRERFKLRFHDEIHEEAGFVLVKASNGRSLKSSKADQEHTGPIYIRRDGAELLLTGEQITIGSLVDFLSGNLQQPIRNETGLDGVYAITLRFTPAEASGNATTALPEPSEAPGPSLFTALQEQLGLELEPRKIPVHIMIIDHAEKASEN